MFPVCKLNRAVATCAIVVPPCAVAKVIIHKSMPPGQFNIFIFVYYVPGRHASVALLPSKRRRTKL